VLVHQVAAKGTCSHHLIALMTLHFPTVPFLCRGQTFCHSCVRCCHELGLDPPGRADHHLDLLQIGFEANTCKKVNKDVQRPLEEFWVPRGQIRVVNVKDCKKAAISSVITASSSSLSSHSCRAYSLATASTRMLKSLADRGLPCVMPCPAQKGDP
jgi:hypothetical protein